MCLAVTSVPGRERLAAANVRARVEQDGAGHDRRNFIDAELLQRAVRRGFHVGLPVAAVVHRLLDRIVAGAVPDVRHVAEVTERIDVGALAARLARHLIHVRGMHRVAHAARRPRGEGERLGVGRHRHRVGDAMRQLVAPRPGVAEERRAAHPGLRADDVAHPAFVAGGPGRPARAWCGRLRGHGVAPLKGWRSFMRSSRGSTLSMKYGSSLR